MFSSVVLLSESMPLSLVSSILSSSYAAYPAAARL